jgi:putative heme iron utilization protein
MTSQLNLEEQRRLRHLLHDSRWAALATVREDQPLASWVAFAAEEGFTGFILHLSRLALHTRYLLDNPRAALTLCEPDSPIQPDPQLLARISLQGRVMPVARDATGYQRARNLYLARLPEAAVQFELGDFGLYRFVVETGRFVSGFGRAHRIGPADLRALAALDAD